MAEIKVISAMEARKRFGEIMNRVALRGERYIVKRAGKSLVSISPVPTSEATKVTKKGPTINEILKRMQFNDPDKNLSMHIDEILYGGGR